MSLNRNSLKTIETSLETLDGKIETQATFSHGQATVGSASAIQLPSATAVKGVLVKSHSGNTGTIYVGNSSGVTTSTGFELGAGEAISLEVSNANLIWLISDTADQVVSWVAV